MLVFFMLSGLCGLLQAQVPVQYFEKEIPVYRWTYGGVPGDTSDLFYPDKEWVNVHALVFTDVDSMQLVYRNVKEHQKVVSARASDWKRGSRELRKLDSVYFPPVFGYYLYQQDGKFGLMTAEGTGVASPVYDQIVFLYQYYAPQRQWALCPVLLVHSNRQYALMHYSGFLVTRFCKRVEELPSAYLMNAANGFKINEKVEPESLWGF